MCCNCKDKDNQTGGIIDMYFIDEDGNRIVEEPIFIDNDGVKWFMSWAQTETE